VLWTDATTSVCYWQNHVNSCVYLSEDGINTDYTGVTGIIKRKTVKIMNLDIPGSGSQSVKKILHKF
jgi:hypothetical protein